MKQILLAAALVGGMLTACTQKSNNNQNNESMNTTFFDKQSAASVERTLTQEWDKVFPLSEKVNHKKVTFETQYGLTLAADLYTPKDAKGKLAAIAVSGPFGAVKEQCSGLYAMRMAELGFVALAFDPSYTGESSGEPRRTASPDINTEDFMAAVDFLSKQENVDAERIGVIGKPNPVPENKQLLIIPNASHCDLYDGGYTDLVGKGEPKDMIPWDKLEEFFKTNLK